MTTDAIMIDLTAISRFRQHLTAPTARARFDALPITEQSQVAVSYTINVDGAFDDRRDGRDVHQDVNDSESGA